MDMFDLASTLFGNRRDPVAQGSTLTATGSAASEDGTAYLVMDADVTPAEGVGDDTDQTVIDVPTSPSVAEGDEVIMTLVGDGPLKTPVVMANPGGGDRMQAQVDSAETLAQQAEAVAQEASAEVEQVRQDVADFRDDVATTYATKVERQDGDDAVKTWVTTNYTNSNDLATTYATKTLVSQTKDAIELAASQTYETQSDAAATYATKSALTVGLNGIRTEVAEDYQPKGDYATTASMNSAIQQSASSIESSVAATYETKSDASTTYATKTEVQQTASGLDTRITTATNTANSAKSAVDNLQVGGTNLLHDTEDWANWACTAQVTVSDGVLTAVNTATVAFRKANGWFVPAKADILNEQIVVSFDAKKSASTALSTMCVQLFETDKPYKSVVSGNITEGKRYYTVLNNAVWHDTAKINDSTWTRVYSDPIVLADVLTGSYPEYAYLAFYVGITNQIGSASYRNVMVERGTIATDWSPAPEDMATEADLQAEVTERQTLIRQFGGGVLAGYVGNAIAALVNAAGSFDVVRTAWTDDVPSILGTLARYAASGISLFDAAGNVLAEFAADHVRIGGAIPEDGSAVATVRFFDSDADKGAMVEGYVSNSYSPTDEDVGWGVQTQDTYTDLHTSTNDSDMEQVNGCAGTADVRLGQTTYWEDGPDGYYQAESTAKLTAAAESGTDPTQTARAEANIGVMASTINDTTGTASIVMSADELTLTDPNAGSFIDTCTVSMSSAITAIMRPATSYTGANNTATASANGWRLTYFNTVLQSDGYPENYYTFNNGVITATKTCSFLISGSMYWNSGGTGQYGFGVFTGSTAGSGTEYSVFNYKASSSGQHQIIFPPRLFRLTAGNSLCIGRYEISGAVYRNGTNMSYLTIEVVR